ncbi:MAG: hypothetical protein K5675_02235 [Lachnospiraceae bacterium]|nr:hypothetical protein [Lachnospiraceae bacterium]
MKIFLIDYENVNAAGLEGIKKLATGDQVHIFYSDRIKNIPFEKSIELSKSSAKIEYIETHKVAKNYLDFQLSTYLGYLVGKEKEGTFIIVSKDTGFDSVVDFWKGRNVTISRSETISNLKKENPKKSLNKKNKKNKETSKKPENKKKEETPKKPENKKKEENPKKPENKKKVESSRKKPQSKKEKESPKKSESKKKLETSPRLQDPKRAEEAKKILQFDDTWRKRVRENVKEDQLTPANYAALYIAVATSDSKQELNNHLTQKLPKEKVGSVYNHIKKLFEEYLKSKK